MGLDFFGIRREGTQVERAASRENGNPPFDSPVKFGGLTRPKAAAPARRRDSIPIRFDLGERPAGADVGISGFEAFVARLVATGSEAGVSKALRFKPATGVLTGILTRWKMFALGL